MRSRFLSDSRNLLSGWGNPVLAVPRDNSLDVHGIQFLERAALAFHDKEVDDQTSKKVAGSKDIAVSKIDGRGDERREEC